MNLFKKLSQRENDADTAATDSITTSSKMNIFNWLFTKVKKVMADEDTATATVENESGQKNVALPEIEFVPKTEITASRQALSNIQLTFHSGGGGGGESSGSKRYHDDNDEVVENKGKRGCENKFCCGVVLSRSHSTLENADEGDDDESIKSFSHKKNFTPNKNHSQSDNDEIKHETISRRSRSINLHDADDDKDFYIYYEPSIDYGIMEVSDLIYPSIMKCGNVVDLKQQRKKPLNYELLSHIEYQLDQSKYNIMNCMLFNCQYHHQRDTLGSGCRPSWKIEDYNDDNKSTPMSHDTKTIKEFYRLNELSDILVHYHDVVVEASHSVGRMKEGVFGFISWLVFKGKEIKEHHKIKEKRSWIRNIPLSASSFVGGGGGSGSK